MGGGGAALVLYYILVTKYFVFLAFSFDMNFSSSVSFVKDFIEMFPYLFMYSTNAIIIILHPFRS